MRHLIKLSTLALCVVLIGCGGGGGGGSGNTGGGGYGGGGGGSGSGGGGTPTPATQFRLLKSGDTLTYAGTGTYQDSNGTFPVTESGTITFGNAAFNGQSVISETDSMTLTIQGHSFNEIEIGYLAQDPVTHDVYELAEIDSQGAMHTDATPTLVTPGTINATTSLNNTINYTDGAWVIQTASVVGAETIQTPVGNFNCWKINRSEKYSNGDATNATDWIDPNVGKVRVTGKSANANPYHYASMDVLLSAYSTRSARNAGFLPPPCGILNGHIMRELTKQIEAHRLSTIP